VSGALLSSVVVKPIAPAGFNTGSPAVDVAVVNAAGEAVIDGVGELAVRAPFVGMTRSFWRDDKRYLESYWQTVPGMWVHGDLALQSKDRGFFMLGRSDDTIKIAGKRLGPAEVEEIVVALADVSEAAAVGLDDPTKGERLAIFVVKVPNWSGDNDALAAQITSQVEQKLGKPFKPSRVSFVNQLPKTRSSKVMRRLIKRILTSQPLGDLSALENPAALDELRTLVE
jgi:acetyl-CoA synthetase